MTKPLSPTQQKVFDLLGECGGNQSEVGRRMGLTESTVRNHVNTIRKKGHKPVTQPHGSNGRYTPALQRTPEEQQQRMKELAGKDDSLRGVSTLYNKDGEISAQWVKADRDKRAEREALEAFAKELAESVRGLVKPVKAPALCREDILSVYPIGDAHFGAYAYGRECGEDFDTDIASRDLASAVVSLVRSAPKSKYGLLVDVGDSLHVDSRSNTTFRGTQQDVDTRYSRVARMLVMAFRHAIDQMLRRHEQVKVIIAPGNHNLDSAGWTALALDMFYENEPRVTVETSPAYFLYHRFGQNLIGVTHGDTVKIDQLASIMATDKPQEWGETAHRIWLTGHIHHKKQQEYRGCLVEAFNTLAAKDAWHTQQGYRSARNMHRLDFHSQYGLFGRSIVDVAMFRDAA